MNGEIIIRKASAHGLGDVMEPREYDPLASEHTRAEHVAASLSDDGATRSYGDICPGKASRLPPDLWRIAFNQFRLGSPKMIDEIVAGLPGMGAPQVSQQTLSTRNAWLAYETLPNKRPFMFFNVLPALRESYFPDPEISAAERRTLTTTSLYAPSDRNGFRLQTLDEYRAVGAGNEGLYSRANHQFPWAIFDQRFSLRLTTIADTLAGYFQHAEQKSRGRTGRLRRKTLVILDHEYIGKETNHLLYANVDDDDEIQIEDAANVPIFRKGVNADMLASFHLDALAQRAGVPKDALRRAIAEERRLAPSAMGEGEIWGNGTAPPYIFGPPGAYTFEIATGINTPANGDTPQTPIVSYYNGDVGFQVGVPEASTWAMMIIGFVGLGFARYRGSQKSVAATA